ncbi:hypothetical protein [Gimesia aquarii]|uniref:Uncharacterized protein n=1 Tax=Gimesia aquarii TaxID=2527964 RepID=A0A517WTX0_9PLAN|nr:hypothetical protein [Gimesia aquarii]QDU08668.1 hypothetical protein V202x_20380 [Gimesia aquarii]
MRAHKNYLLNLDSAPTTMPQNGSQSTIYDWSGGESFQVVNVVTTKSDWHPAAHVLAIFDNSYVAGNLAGSRLRYRDNGNTLETREIVGITPLD